MGIYSILKYGAIPEPITISNNVSAVPAGNYMRYDLENHAYSICPYLKFEFRYGDGQSPNELDPGTPEANKKVLKKCRLSVSMG